MAKKNTKKANYTVNVARGLNLREAPGGKVLAILPVGCAVVGEACEKMPKWIEVDAGERHGWVMAEYLTVAEVEADTDAETEGGEADAGESSEASA